MLIALPNTKVLMFFNSVIVRPEQMNFTINSNSSVAYAIIGSKVNMTCSAESSPPADFRIGFQGSPTAKAIGTTFIIEAAKITDSGIYECSASNGIGLPVTKLARLIVVGMAHVLHFITPIAYFSFLLSNNFVISEFIQLEKIRRKVSFHLGQGTSGKGNLQ